MFAMLSGGVDSSVAAALAKKGGFDVRGFFMKNWEGGAECTWLKDEQDARRVAARLQIPFHVLNFEKEYRKQVFNPFIRGLAQGITPNPDVYCNAFVKFGVFLNYAKSLGADYVATGHYAKVVKKDKAYQLHQPKDKWKDQTYFLYLLTQEQLAKTLFPLANYTKTEVRKLAQNLKLPTYNKPDSQGICFVGQSPFAEFVSRFIPERAGAIIDSTGTVLGTHRGLAYYTIGQRKGIGIGGAGTPYFVSEKRLKDNQLVVTKDEKKELYKKQAWIGNLHWIGSPLKTLGCSVRFRHGQALQTAKVTLKGKKALVEFKEPQRALTAGQALVLYRQTQVIGGGSIL